MMLQRQIVEGGGLTQNIAKRVRFMNCISASVLLDMFVYLVVFSKPISTGWR